MATSNGRFGPVVSWLIFAAALYGCYDQQILQKCLDGSGMKKEYYDLCLVALGGVLAIKLYLEVIKSGVKKQQVNYESHGNIGNLMIGCAFAAFGLFVAALWPSYKVYSILVAVMVFYGVLFNFIALVPMPLILKNALLTVGFAALVYNYRGGFQ